MIKSDGSLHKGEPTGEDILRLPKGKEDSIELP